MNQYLPKPLAIYPGDLPEIIDEKARTVPNVCVRFCRLVCVWKG